MKTASLVILLSAVLTVSFQTAQAKPKKQTDTGAAAGSVSSQTNQNLCCRYPLRVFGNNSTVNLAPLFHWWTHHATDDKAGSDAGATTSRPLAAWHRITGTKAGELEYSWIVNAEIYTSPGSRTNARIILNNPPVTEEQTFYTLKSELANASQQMTNDQRTYQADTKAAQAAKSRPQPVKISRRERVRPNPNANTQRAAQDQEAATAALNDQKQLEQATALAQKKLDAIPSANGQYRIDWFALEIGRDKQGVPIYDLGVVDYNNSP